MHVQPYLYFDGQCEEAIEFYKNAISAKVQMLMRFKDCPVPIPQEQLQPGSEEKVMHATLRIGDSMINLSDGSCRGNTAFKGFGLTLSAADDAEADRLFAGLADGGKVTMPLSKTFFSPRFGVVTDRFGLLWMVMTQP